MNGTQWPVNAAFVGGGVASVIGLGGYAKIREDLEFSGFSGASLGAVIATCLAAGKKPEEVLEFLAQNALKFNIPIVGKTIIRNKVDDFLNWIKFEELSMECVVSIGTLGKKTPKIITRENAEGLTVGEVVAVSCSMPGLFLPSMMHIDGKRVVAFDGGFVLNPPLNPDYVNVLFSYRNKGSMKHYPWNDNRRRMEAMADALFAPDTKIGVLGAKVKEAFEEGVRAMEKEKEAILLSLSD